MISPDFSSVVMLSLGHIQQAQENKIAQVKKPFDWMTDEQFHNLQVLATHFEWFQVCDTWVDFLTYIKKSHKKERQKS